MNTETITTTEQPAPAVSIFAKLIRAQQKFSKVIKAMTNEYFSERDRNGKLIKIARYADLSMVLDAVKPALNDEGLFLFQRVQTTEDRVAIETILATEDGQQLSSGVAWFPVVKTNPQGFGSAITYARRYQLTAFLGVAQEDDDGNAASGNTSAPAPQQQQVNAKPKITQDLRDRAVAAAQNGTDAYKQFFKNLPSGERAALSGTDFHNEMKALAAEQSAGAEA